MAEVTKIQWTDHTFNPWIGCTKVAPGCVNCYAEADMDKRRGRVEWGPNGTRSRTSDAYWREPIKWNKAAECLKTFDCNAGSHSDACPQSNRPRVFCASLADVFEDWTGRFIDTQGRTLHRGANWGVKAKYVYDHIKIGKSVATIHDLRADLFDLIDATPNLDWLLLTKRPENILRVICPNEDPSFPDNGVSQYFRKNLQLGTSISDQATAGKAVPELMRCRDLARVLFLSAEPLLGPVDLSRVGNHDGTSANRFDGNCLYVGDIGGAEYAWSPRNFIQWVIVGGESGPNARPCNPKWIRSLVEQCKAAGVRCFVKQLGANIVLRNDDVEDQFNNDESGWPDPHVEYDIHGYRENFQGADCRVCLQDKKGGNPEEWPADLRVREFPTAHANV